MNHSYFLISRSGPRLLLRRWLGIVGPSVLLATLLLGGRSAHADGAPPAPPAPVLCKVSSPREGAPSVDSNSKKAKKEAHAHSVLGKKAYDEGKFVLAIQELQAAYELDPTLDVLYNVAQACREAGYSREALGLYEQILGRVPDPALKLDSERHIKALRPKLGEAENARAIDLLAKQQYPEAAAAWEAAYQLDPQPAYLFRCAQSQSQGGSTAAAVASYERLLGQAPTSSYAPEAKVQLATLRAKQHSERAIKHLAAQEYGQAIAAWDAAFQASPQPVFLFRLAESERLAKLDKEAVAAYRRFLAENPQGQLSEERRQAEAHLLALCAQPGIAACSAQPARSSRVAAGLTPATTPVYKKGWFWAVIGIVAAGAIAGGVGAGVVAAQKNPLPDLPHFSF